MNKLKNAVLSTIYLKIFSVFIIIVAIVGIIEPTRLNSIIILIFGIAFFGWSTLAYRFTKEKFMESKNSIIKYNESCKKMFPDKNPVKW